MFFIINPTFPDEPGLAMVALHYNVNTPIQGLAAGQHGVDINTKTGSHIAQQCVQLGRTLANNCFREQFPIERVVFCARAKHTFVDRNNNNIMAAPTPLTFSFGRHFVSVSWSPHTTSGICSLCLANVCNRSPPTDHKVDTVS